MLSRDRQIAGRIVHVCSDPSGCRVVQAAAESAGLVYHHFTDSFAAALFLLKNPNAPGVVLLALDSLSRIELGICSWAAKNRPDLLLWAYGRADRLNGHDPQGRLRAVRAGDLPQLLAGVAGDQKNCGLRNADCEAGAPTCELGQNGEPTESSPQQSCEANESSIPQSDNDPQLRLRTLGSRSDEPLVTEEELAALLGQEGDDA